ncbi:MAG: UDP-N-acetylmuramoyl-L-alanyl-D-glutamate--2,6-diaminopimelate ligase [Myxococcales bacterium]|nr:UDP-N-acetylmuramoyl-L-alanyl-D-glutamate--2,6-diaminopimelate ligase [Myxococcales bacterium]
MTLTHMVPETPAPGLTLGELARELAGQAARVVGDDRVRILDVRQDSRRIAPGDLFAARPGGRADGTSFVADAVARGARAVMVQRGGALPDVAVPILEVADVRRAVAFAAEAVHHHPSRAVGVVGITGTNGKTTTSYLTQSALSAAGARAGRLGTLGFAFESDVIDSPLTTPEADEVTRYVARVRDRGGSHLVMEASSHALSLCRVEALELAAAVFTNLTQDHLDFHGSMQAYAAAKLRLFTELSPRVSVVNVDDPFGVSVAASAQGRVLRVSKGIGAADVCPVEVVSDARGIRGRIRLPSGEVEVESRLVGTHNLDNLLAALAVVEGLGLDAARAARGLADAPAVPGRLERCDTPDDDVLVLVDYAHTPDALERVLETCRTLTRGELICVFGCGGDRDREKRPKMGDAVGRLASRAIVTNDNPRSEEPGAIAAAIVPGLAPHGIPFEVELDRARAIERAVLSASAGDVVLIAGKGHEPYQIVGSERRDFDDRAEARRALALRRGGGQG